MDFQIKPSSILGILPIVALSFNADAKPWLDTGDMKLRHQLQLLSDSGLLDAPLTTWPLSSNDIHSKLKKPAEGTRTNLLNVLNSINQRLENEDYGTRFTLEANANSKKLLIRDFSGEGRENGSVSYDADWGNPVVDIRLKTTLANKSDHPSDKTLRFDESYISSTFDKWKFTVGRQSRWWGPSWDGSLILSNNARPIPSISVENVSSRGYNNHKYLKWLGPNKLHIFMGQLESDRGVPNTKLIGTRFTFKPNKSLEVGLSRVTQWGGKGQNNSLSDLFKTLLSLRSNKKDQPIRGNHIAGIDVRWNIPVGGAYKYSLYSQYIGEDRAEGSLILGDETFLFGGSMSGFSKDLNGSWRTYLEATDTSAASFKGRARNNIIYNHSVYTDGYRHQGLSMGHGIDSDSKIISAGFMLAQDNGNFWRSWAKHARLNSDGTGKNPIAQKGKKWSALGISLEKKLDAQSSLNLGVQFITEKINGKDRENDLSLSVGYTHDF